jgi:hypothetical protein
MGGRCLFEIKKMSKSQMSIVDALLMSSAIKDQARQLVCKVPSYMA